MVQPVELLEAPVQIGFGNIGDLGILPVAGFVMHQPHQAAPKAVGPPADAVRIGPAGIFRVPVIVGPVYGHIGDFMLRFFTDPI
ncbi:hypothetical protein D3C81_2031910 [compost metagenome]